MNHRLCLLILSLLLGACSTTEKKKTPPVMSQRMSDRITASRKRMADPNDRSVFDKSMQTSYLKGKDTGGWLGSKKYKSNSYAGSKSYTNTKAFKADSFSGSDDRSTMSRQKFAPGDDASSLADQNFATDNSTFADKSAREGSQTFSEADNSFKTSAEREALRSQKKNDRPKFIELDEQKKNPAYTEEQVRRLLGR